jgi:hypothetical protein
MEPGAAPSVIEVGTRGAEMSRFRPADTRWKRVEAEWRSFEGDSLPAAFGHLKHMLPIEEYEGMVREYRDGRREVRIENGFIVTCFTPGR